MGETESITVVDIRSTYQYQIGSLKTVIGWERIGITMKPLPKSVSSITGIPYKTVTDIRALIETTMEVEITT